MSTLIQQLFQNRQLLYRATLAVSCVSSELEAEAADTAPSVRWIDLRVTPSDAPITPTDRMPRSFLVIAWKSSVYSYITYQQTTTVLRPFNPE